MIGDNIRRARHRSGMTLTQLANRMAELGGRPVSGCTVGAWERNEKQIDARHIPYLAMALRCSISSLFEEGTIPAEDLIMDLALKEEYLQLTVAERRILIYAFLFWPGNIHALLQMLGLYVSLPPMARADVSFMSILRYTETDPSSRLPGSPPVDLEYLEAEWERLVKKKVDK